MTRIALMSALTLTLALAPASSNAERGGRTATPLERPEDVMCTIGADAVQVTWATVEGASKYAVSFECEDPTGTMEMDVEYEPDERLTDLLADVPFDVFPAEVILLGDGAWTCLAKVKGLNPPGRQQAHGQGVDLCE
jgi:hypothetical protein